MRNTTFAAGLLASPLLALSAPAQTINYAEDFEGFATGALAGQNGWQSENPEGIAIEDTGIAGFGSRTLVLRPTVGSSGTSSPDLAVSPLVWTAPEGRFEADVRIADTSYEFEVGLEHAGSLWNARVRMASDGGIDLLSAPSGLLIWTSTSATWAPGEIFRLGLETEGNLVRVYKNGQVVGSGGVLSQSTPTVITSFAVRQTWPGQSGPGAEMLVDNITYDTCPPPVNYCSSTPNSNASYPNGASITYSGSRYISGGDGRLAVFGAAAGVPCVYVASASQAQVPFGNGFLCLGAPRKRLGPTQTTSPSNLPFTSGGSVFRDLDLTVAPLDQITAGSTWNFQLWFRDAAGGGAQTNLSDAVSVTYCP